MFYSVSRCPGVGQCCGELDTGPAAGGPGQWAGWGSHRGLSRDSQGWQCHQGPDSLLTLFQNNGNLSSSSPAFFFLNGTVCIGATSTVSHTVTAVSETSLPETSICILQFFLHLFWEIVNPTALAEIVFHHHILRQLLPAGEDQPSETPLLLAFAGSQTETSRSYIQRRAGHFESSPGPSWKNIVILRLPAWLDSAGCSSSCCYSWFCCL